MDLLTARNHLANIVRTDLNNSQRCPRHQPRKAHKGKISNAGLTITALPRLAARDWGTFKANGLDVEIIVTSPPLGAAAMAQATSIMRPASARHR